MAGLWATLWVKCTEQSCVTAPSFSDGISVNYGGEKMVAVQLLFSQVTIEKFQISQCTAAPDICRACQRSQTCPLQDYRITIQAQKKKKRNLAIHQSQPNSVALNGSVRTSVIF